MGNFAGKNFSLSAQIWCKRVLVMDQKWFEIYSRWHMKMLLPLFSLTKSTLSEQKGLIRLFEVSLVLEFLSMSCVILIFFRNDNAKEGELEVQRTLLELLNQLDGFDKQEDVKIIMATNRISALDPALIRPGRIDRKIEFPNLDSETRQKVFDIQTRRMHLAPEVTFKTLDLDSEDVTGADITAICTEAGIMALRQRRTHILIEDFKQAKENVFIAKKMRKQAEEMFL
jgi:SpoVK/Ycf46/Vps4 family AAA+-type ATPase